MWSRAVYDFGLTTEEFWELTPKHFYLLHQRHLDQLLHREMCHALTTAAVLNSAFYRPEQAVSPLDYMPNHPDRVRPSTAKVTTPAQQKARADYLATVAQVVAELKTRSETGENGKLMQKLGISAD